jgi:hypothetical protein
MKTCSLLSEYVLKPSLTQYVLNQYDIDQVIFFSTPANLKDGNQV